MKFVEERSIDDLGKIVIPKEIRRELKICENDRLKFYIDGDRIILKKIKVKNTELNDRIEAIKNELLFYEINEPNKTSEIISHIEQIREIVLDGRE